MPLDWPGSRTCAKWRVSTKEVSLIKIQGAVIKEQGVTFAITIVKHHITGSSVEANRLREELQGFFPGAPLVLASQDSRGVFRYHGRTDLVKFLANIDPSRIPWKEYTFS